MQNRENISKIIDGIDDKFILEAEVFGQNEAVTAEKGKKRKNLTDKEEQESRSSGLWRVLIAFASAAAVFLVVYFGIVKKADKNVTVNSHTYISEDESYHEKITGDKEILSKLLSVAEILQSEEMKKTIWTDERFGGYYVSGDKIVICVTDTAFHPLDNEYVKYKKVKRSYLKLVRDMNTLTDGTRDWMDNKKNSDVYKLCQDGFAVLGFNYEYNTIIVAFGNLDDAKRGYFDSVFPDLDYFVLIDTEKGGNSSFPAGYPYMELKKLVK